MEKRRWRRNNYKIIKKIVKVFGELYMFNMLIVDDNIFYAKKLVNIIGDNIKDIRIFSVATSGFEAINMLQKDNIDIVLLDLKMPRISGLDILNSLSEEQSEHYENSIILISGESELIVKARNNKTVYGYVVKGSGTDNLIIKINEIIEEKNNSMKEKDTLKRIIKEVQFLGYNLSYKGTTYLVESIYYMITNPNKNYDNLSKSVYPILSKKHNKSIGNIKVNISKATDIMYYECERNRLNEYFNFYLDYKPKPKSIISTIINKLAF